MNIKQFHSVLSDFFPKVLSVIIIEYVSDPHILVQTDKSYEHTMFCNTACTIKNGKAWSYSVDTKILSTTDIEETIVSKFLYLASNMFTYDTITGSTNICVAHIPFIKLYNERCEHIRYIELLGTDSRNSVIKIINEKIYITKQNVTKQNVMIIYDIYGNLIKKIEMKYFIRDIKSSKKYIYIIPENELMMQYELDDENFTKVHRFEKIRMFNIKMFIVDDFLYIGGKAYISVYDEQENYITGHLFGHMIHFNFDGSILYIMDRWVGKIKTYKLRSVKHMLNDSL